MPTGWDSILTVISFGNRYGYGLEMLLDIIFGNLNDIKVFLYLVTCYKKHK